MASDAQVSIAVAAKSMEGAVDLASLQIYDARKMDIQSIDLVNGPLYMRDFLAAFEAAAKMAIRARKKYEDAKTEAKHQEAKAKLERFTAYYEANKATLGALKDSSSLRDAYVDLDQDYMDAKERVNALQALTAYLDNKTESYRMAHDDAKKIYGQLQSGPFARSGYTGLSSGGHLGDEG